MKDVTPTKEKVRVQAGRQGGPTVAKAANLPAVQLQPSDGPRDVLSIIAVAAANPAINPATMRELLEMQKEVMAMQAKTSFNEAFIALQTDLPSITRDGKIEIRAKDSKGERNGIVQQATPYASFNNIMKTIKPLLIKHGFALSFSTEPTGERLLVKGLLEGHGHERTTAFPLPAETSGSKNNVQGWGSSMSYGKRYCTIALLNIVSHADEDRDTDGHQGNFKPAKGGGVTEVDQVILCSPAQQEELRDLIAWCGVSEAKFKEHYGKVSELRADLFDAAKKACQDFHANQQAKVKHG